MPDAEYSKSRAVRYLAWTFGLAYIIRIGAAALINGGNAMAGQLVVAVMMFVPALGVLLRAGEKTA